VSMSSSFERMNYKLSRLRNTRSYRGLNRSRWRLGKSLSRHRISHWLRGARLVDRIDQRPRGASRLNRSHC
jgi:hypothetical protein